MLTQILNSYLLIAAIQDSRNFSHENSYVRVMIIIVSAWCCFCLHTDVSSTPHATVKLLCFITFFCTITTISATSCHISTRSLHQYYHFSITWPVPLLTLHPQPHCITPTSVSQSHHQYLPSVPLPGHTTTIHTSSYLLTTSLHHHTYQFLNHCHHQLL